VRGHDHVIDRLFSRIHEALTLRARRRDRSTQPPLASFLLVGGQGWESVSVTRRGQAALSKWRYPGVECDRVTAETQVGTKAAPGELLESVRRQPCQVIIFDGIDRSSPI